MNFLFLSLLLSVFPNIDQTIPEGPFSYSGISVREVITVDPENAPLLTNACADLKRSLEKEILLKTLSFVEETLFDKNCCTQAELLQLLHNYAGEKPDAEIPLEVFLEEKTGVCRHIALTTTYLVQSLIKEGLLKGEVFLIRDQTPHGRHAWTLFLSNEGAWHLDPYWGIFENGKTGAGFSHLCKKYGKRTMERQKVRWENGN